MNFKELSEKRRSINFFDPDRDVPEQTLINIVDIAANTPSSFNLQPWNLMVLRDPEDKGRLQKLAKNTYNLSTHRNLSFVFGSTGNGKKAI